MASRKPRVPDGRGTEQKRELRVLWKGDTSVRERPKVPWILGLARPTRLQIMPCSASAICAGPQPSTHTTPGSQTHQGRGVGVFYPSFSLRADAAATASRCGLVYAAQSLSLTPQPRERSPARCTSLSLLCGSFELADLGRGVVVGRCDARFHVCELLRAVMSYGVLRMAGRADSVGTVR